VSTVPLGMPSRPSKREYRSGTVLAGKFKLQRQLGRGAMGMVWSAINIATSRQVALKLLLNPDPKSKERLQREARAAGALKHPNVVDVYDVIETEDGSPVLVLEMLEGQTLQQVMSERAPLPQKEVAAIGRDIARALAVAHASGIVHRDLKPANIFLHRPTDDDAPIVKVVDFGISKNLLATEGTLTQAGTAVGTPSFMSPEQVRGERKIDGRTDLWALGVILYEMLTIGRLFDGRPHEVLTRVLVQPIKPISGLDATLSGVINGLLQRDLDARLSSAEEVADWLATIAPPTAVVKSLRPTAPPPAPLGEVYDTTLSQLRNAKNPVPKIHEDDDDDDEATRVAPKALRKAVVPKAPAIYTDDEDEDEARTRVAANGELNEVIDASREVKVRQPYERDGDESDQNVIPTLRPPAEPSEGAEAAAEPAVATSVRSPPSARSSQSGQSPPSARSPLFVRSPSSRPSSPQAARANHKAAKNTVRAAEQAIAARSAEKALAARSAEKAIAEKPEKNVEKSGLARVLLLAFLAFALVLLVLFLVNKSR
jgi:serine/threonine protein kinase